MKCLLFYSSFCHWQDIQLYGSQTFSRPLCSHWIRWLQETLTDLYESTATPTISENTHTFLNKTFKRSFLWNKSDFWLFSSFFKAIPSKIFQNQMKLCFRGVFTTTAIATSLSIHFYHLYFTRETMLNLQTAGRWLLAWANGSPPDISTRQRHLASWWRALLLGPGFFNTNP